MKNKKQRLLNNRRGKDYDAVLVSSFETKSKKDPDKKISIETWGLYKRVLFFFWKRIEIGTPAKIINKAKKLNGMTGSHKTTIDTSVIAVGKSNPISFNYH